MKDKTGITIIIAAWTLLLAIIGMIIIVATPGEFLYEDSLSETNEEYFYKEIYEDGTLSKETYVSKPGEFKDEYIIDTTRS